MKTRFYFDPTLVKGIPIIFEVLFVLMAGASLLVEVSLRPAVFLVVANIPLLLFWIGFARGTYITVDDKNIYGRVLFIPGKITQLSDIISIRRNSTFGGLMSEVIMEVRKKDGKVIERGLINKPGLTESDFKKLIETIVSINPNVEVDKDLLQR